jgi:DNA modification methylase
MHDAADNASKSYEVAISSLRERLEKSKVVIGDCTLYCEEAEFILPTLIKADAVLTDPPYGVKMDKGFEGFEGFGGFGRPIARRRYEDDDWDSDRPSADLFNLILKAAKHIVIFGGNYFTDYLPVGRHWIVWDKLNTMPSFGDCELAWTNIPRKSVKKITIEYNGLLGKEQERVHPTQKPISIMAQCVQALPKGCETILDPFMGSGTTGVACVKLGRKFIGIERERKYFDIACRRIEQAYAQGDLFVAAPSAKPKQLDLEESLSNAR